MWSNAACTGTRRNSNWKVQKVCAYFYISSCEVRRVLVCWFGDWDYWVLLLHGMKHPYIKANPEIVSITSKVLRGLIQKQLKRKIELCSYKIPSIQITFPIKYAMMWSLLHFFNNFQGDIKDINKIPIV